ncbi:adenosylmethionine-8-amino-7-oxononanoate aminotransferase [Psychrosphaera saromensis]|uniref:Adenosylmethionine-8-amino-7-oxononanoate aminotransferase n=1 Tax=Psychrosphaera saromensis TaxID=716813 RepID=A0A2S7UWR6_9GAMM|nr:adenosylmethionine--8-amino-7-oxononanoate transaminase [Psychrosphaera saromensis]PQJ54393.1 adenosylmethionine--8-amino-7-oxononanoate transaminase [Psychrosphaera saromensis]GHB60348.1 adenosylmethionine-8-amino-7-oxononanoate aminotransferase [Psychrosphaera saromensis]GLQ14603.1 adenosylmethionine-8-amino-7-oxononanoate aminotransferase [Psychrosphaera saromensis]
MNKSIDVKFDEQHIWHPYTSMQSPLPSYPVKSADGVRITLENGTELIDGMSSWWSVIHGYNHPVINQAITEQLSKMSHVMFGGLTHRPAIDLCKKLVELTPKGLEKVFLADSGSVSVEVALKMAIQCQLGRGYKNRNKFVTIKHGYHGDTFGAMAVCDPVNSMHSLYSDILPKNYFIDAPKSKPNGTFNLAELDELKALLQNSNEHIAALILEPVVQGAGGMRFYHPDFISGAKAICEQYNILLIADEIATGFGRTGKMFACEHAKITPDILCLGKAITGGYMTLAATLCTDKVALDISQCEAGVLMHGPTFMANPLACAAANASLSLLMTGEWFEQVKQIELGLRDGLQACLELETVADVRVLGAIGVVEMKKAVNVAEIQKLFMQYGLWIRPFGKLVYVMPQYVISKQDLTSLTSGIVNTLKAL